MSQSLADRSVQRAHEFDAARQRMVDAQIRPAQINDPRIIALMRVLPREECVAPSLRDFAYADQSLPLGGGRFLTEPRVVARLVQNCDIQAGDRVLVVGASGGYSAALISGLGAEVTALESDAERAALGRSFTARHAPGVTWADGALSDGCPALAPYDLIFIDGGVAQVPEPLVTQLVADGCLAGVLASPGRVPSAFIATRLQAALTVTPLFDAAVPVLPAFALAPVFSF
ncbi:protein-L-isoaspartate O-methyltransferase [Ameyamaea chiangmaiensis NBRC 103196]|uniref:protein-L-isoaspartate O-methyltransferase family protein n=1 Tax=Ameyamaea chiangmaiensis TaxID=442969 RepID=UPI001FE59C32|nr:protein-L-isoaspartate O-methyltransferase [Ameyamaea chiangmaiensis]GBQ68957.1 protein-L-isoaspartate O-methyltransferase [Ameyamaea chiangmaiensis NBRC 103196]